MVYADTLKMFYFICHSNWSLGVSGGDFSYGAMGWHWDHWLVCFYEFLIIFSCEEQFGHFLPLSLRLEKIAVEIGGLWLVTKLTLNAMGRRVSQYSMGYSKNLVNFLDPINIF